MSIDRRKFLFALGASALPAGCAPPATASPAFQNDPETVDQILDRLVEALKQSNPAVSSVAHRLSVRKDGSIQLFLTGEVAGIVYDGPGFYEISRDGYPMIYWVERDEDHEPRFRGDDPPFYCTMHDCGGITHTFSAPKFISKLSGDLA